jgi:hypothetical protein
MTITRSDHRRLAAIAAGIVLGAILLAPGASGATSTPFNTNLIVDPGAEEAVGADGYVVVPIPGWTTTSNFTAAPYGGSGLPSAAEGARIGGGSLFFSGGASNTSATATQRIALVGRGRPIDQGGVCVVLSAWLGGWADQRDSAQVIVKFLRADGSVIRSMKTAAVSATNATFLRKSVRRQAPAGTRALEVVLAARRGDGAYNDGYFDLLDLQLKRTTCPAA